MKFQVAFLPAMLTPHAVHANTLAIVVDTLRFTTTACQALAAGAQSLWIAEHVDEVRELASSCESSPERARVAVQRKMCGERHCRPIDGFDLGNSPWEYTTENVSGVDLFCTTTNGTRAVVAAKQAHSIWLSSLVNRQATVDKLLRDQPAEIWIVCAGTDRQLALEDILTAGAIVDLAAQRSSQVQVHGDAAWIARATWASLRVGQTRSADREELMRFFARAEGGRNLIEAGYSTDLEFAANVDALEIVPTSTPSHWNCFRA